MNADRKRQRKANVKIEKMIGNPFINKDENVRPCWSFCRGIIKQIGGDLPKSPKGLQQTSKAKVWCVVLFNFRFDWHAGVVWPDGLHFVHYDEDRKQVCKNRLTESPWRMYIEGYYTW